MDLKDGDDLRKERKLISANLKETISSRKVERKKEMELRRKTDLELIRRRNLHQEGGKNPLEIFPKKVWVTILEKVDGTENIKNARDVCTLFKELLEEKYFTQVLFVEVMSLEPFKNPPRRPPPEYDATQGLSPKAKLRLVSKQWREAVDFYIEQGLRNLELVQEKGTTWRRHEIPRIEIKSTAENLELLDKMSMAFEESQKKKKNCGSGEGEHHLPLKFFPRSVIISLLRDTPPRAVHSVLCSTVPRFVRAMGNEILRLQVLLCIVDVKRAGITWREMYLQLRSWMEFLPNLVWLEVGICCSMCSKKEYESLKTCLRENPFPKIKGLKKLSLTIGYPPKESELRIFNSILEANQQVTDLIFEGRPKVEDVGEGSKLQLPIHSFEGIQTLDLVWVKFYPDILKPTWPLRKVGLYLCSYNTPTDVRVLFRMLENFETIQWLKIYLNNVLCKNPGFLRLPNLTYFSYKFHEVYSEKGRRKRRGRGEAEGMFAIDFLFFMKKLEVFDWNCKAYYPAEPLKKGEAGTEIIQFGRGKMNLRFSNIWDILPNLRMVRVGTTYFHQPILAIERGFWREDRVIMPLSKVSRWVLYDYPSVKQYSKLPPSLSPSESDSDDEVNDVD